jgi:hypothetical protein
VGVVVKTGGLKEDRPLQPEEVTSMGRQDSKGRLSRRGFLKTAGLTGAGLALAPMLLGTGRAQVAGGALVYRFVNKTNGKWTDDQIFWSLDVGKTWQSIAKEPTAPSGRNGRLYFCVGNKPANFADWATYWDFIEFNCNGRRWMGNTTQVEGWCLPLTIELGQNRAGITGPRTKIFETFKKDAPKAFQNCVVGENAWLLSPFMADLGLGKPFADYFEKYVDAVWKMYEGGAPTPSEKFVGNADPNGALMFSPIAGGKPIVCARKPTTKDILLGTGPLGGSPQFCAAFNRHVAEDPADWRNPAKFYLKEPCNWYSKFIHEHAVDHKAYGFCYDDFADQAAFFSGEGDELVVTFYWD